MIKRFGSWIASHPILTLGILGAITAFFLVFAPRIEFLADMEKMLPGDDPVVQRLRETQRLFGSQSAILIGVAPRDGKSLFTVEHVSLVYRLTQELEALVDQGFLEEVISPTNVQIVKSGGLALVVRKPLKAPPGSEAEVEEFRKLLLSQKGLVGSLVRPNGEAFLIILNIHPEIEDNKEKIAELMDRLDEILALYESSLAFYLTGDVAFIHFMDLYMRRDLVFLFPVVVLVVLGVLYLSFRSLRGVVLPLVVVIVAVIWVMGLMSLSGVKLSMISSFLPVLLVAVGSAYGIHVVNDYFKKAPLHTERKSLIIEVVEDMANPVFASALTTAAGFLTLISAFLVPIKQFGIFAAVGVMFSFVISITLIPTVLSLLPLPAKRRGGVEALGKLPRFLAGIVYRHRVLILAVVSLAFVAFLALIPKLEVESDMATYFRSDAPVIKGLEFVEEHFGGSQQMSVVVDAGRRDGIKDPVVLSFISDLEAFLEGSGIVGNTVSIADLVKETNYALHGEDEAYYRVPDSSRAVAQLLLLFQMGGGEILQGMVTDDFSKAQIIVRVRSVGTKEYKKLLEAADRFIAENAPPGVTGYLTGSLGIYVHISDKIVSSQIVSLFASFGAVWLIVSVLLGTAVGGGFALLPLVVSVVGNFGVMALAGVKLDIATVMIASLVIGIGVDYAVHFVTRYRRERRRGLSDREALEVTYDTAGRAIIYNAATLAMGFLVLLLSSFRALSTMGWLVALTMVTSSAGALLVLPVALGVARPGFLVKVRQGRVGATITAERKAEHSHGDSGGEGE